MEESWGDGLDHFPTTADSHVVVLRLFFSVLIEDTSTLIQLGCAQTSVVVSDIAALLKWTDIRRHDQTDSILRLPVGLKWEMAIQDSL